MVVSRGQGWRDWHCCAVGTNPTRTCCRWVFLIVLQHRVIAGENAVQFSRRNPTGLVRNCWTNTLRFSLLSVFETKLPLQKLGLYRDCIMQKRRSGNKRKFCQSQHKYPTPSLNMIVKSFSIKFSLLWKLQRKFSGHKLSLSYRFIVSSLGLGYKPLKKWKGVKWILWTYKRKFSFNPNNLILVTSEIECRHEV